MKQLVSIFILFFAYSVVFGQGVGIGTATPDASAKLDISASNKGLLIPRVNLVSTTSPIASPVQGLLVFNTNNSFGSGEGFYYWDGGQWVRFSTSAPNNSIQNQNALAQLGNFWISGNGHLNGAQIDNLGGSGNQMVVADNNGNLSAQALPTDAQLLTYDPTTGVLSIANGNNVNLSSLNTDNQILSFDPTTGNLTISGGNNVTLPVSAADITDVTAGAGLTGGATSGAATLDIGAGNGIAVNANDVAVKYDNASIGVNSAGELEVKNYLPTTRTLTVNGTTNQIAVTPSGAQDLSTDRSWTISTPQDIHTGATPTFNDLTLTSNNTAGGVVYTNGLGNLNTSAAGTAGQFLQSTGAGAPIWVSSSASTTNLLSSSVNTLTSTVNGVVATADAVNTVGNTSSGNNLTTTVNGVSGTAVQMVNGVSNDINAGVLTTTVNGVTGTGVTLPTADGSETKVTGGTNISVTGSGTLASPYVIANSFSVSTNDVTSTTPGLTVGNGTGQVVGASDVTVDYNLVTGIGALSSGVQGLLGGSGNANTYIGADGLQHLLPSASAATTNLLSSSVNTLTSTVNGVLATAPAVNSVSNDINAGVLTTTVNGVVGTGVTLPTADGSETIINAGTNISVTGAGTTASPYVIDNTFTEVDGSVTNEIQTLSITGNVISLTSGGNVTLPAQTAYTAGTGISITGTTIDNTGDLSNTNELQTITQVGNTITLSNGGGVVTTTDAQTLGITGNSLSISNGNAVALPTADGSETIITPGSNITVTGSGTTASPYVIANSFSVSTNDVTSTTPGLIVGNGVGQVVGSSDVTVDYNLVTGIGALSSGAQGLLGGSGTANTYIGADGLQHLLPSASAATTNLLSSSVNTLTSTVNGVLATAPAVNSVSNDINAGVLTTTVNGVVGTGVTLPTADGSETIINAGTNISVTGAGTTASPYVIDNTFTEVDGSVMNEIQTLSITGNVISLTSGGSVTLPAQTAYTAGTGISITGTTIDNTGDLSNTNELQTITQVGNTITLSNGGGVVTTTDAQTLGITGNSLSISNGNAVTLPTADGSETIINAGSNISVTGSGTTASPYVIANSFSVSTNDVTSTTPGLTVGNGTGQVVGASDVTVDYNLVTGIGALSSGAQGLLGGSGGANTYIGADGLQHLLPSASAATTNLLSSSVNTLTSTVNGEIATAPAVNSVSNDINAGVLTTTVNGVAATGVTLPTADGSETIINAGTNISVTGAGTTASPYVIDNTFTEVDGSVTNELQTLSITGNVISLTSGGSVTLPAQTAYTAGTGISITGTTIDNTGDLSNTNELQTITQVGNTITLSNGGGVVTTTDAQTLGITGNSLSISNGNAVTLPTADGSETIITPGSNITVTGSGTTASPYVIANSFSVATNDVTSTTPGLTVGNGTGQVVGASDVTVDYNLVTGIGALSSGAQGLLGGSGNANTYIGADGLQHLLPSASAATTNLLSSSVNTLTSTVNGEIATAPIVNSVSNDITSGVLTTTVNGVAATGVTLPVADGSETIINAGTNISVTGAGTTASPYVIDNTFTEVDGSVTNELQTLSISGNVISLTNGGNVTLPAQTAYTAGTGISITGTTIDNTGDLSNTNELQTITQVGNTITLSNGGGVVTTTDAQTLGITGNSLSISNGNAVALPTADGSETIITPGSNITVTGSGTLASPYIIANSFSVATNDVTSTTPGLIVGNGANQVVGASDVTVDYNLVTGIGALSSGAQGLLGGSGTANTYIGADGLQHLLPSAAAATTNTLSLNSNDLTSAVNGVSSTVNLASYLDNTDGQSLTYDASNANLSISGGNSVTISGVTPSGAAGGDLSGTYPNPTVADNSVDGTDLQIGGETAGQILQYNGTDWVAVSASSTTTNTLVNNGTNTLTSTVNGVVATADAVNTVGNTSSGNNLTTTVNGVSGTAVQMVNGVSNNITSGVLTTTVNGVAATGVTLPVADGSETIINAGASINVTGNGTSATPYVITNAGDVSNTNEIQSLSYNGTTGELSISSGNNVIIPISTGDITDVTAGAGLTGGATSGAATLDIGAGNGISVNADDIAVKYDNTSVGLNGSGELEVKNYLPTTRTLTINGTTNQVSVTPSGAQDLSTDRTWTVSTPQDIHTAATPTFSDLTLSANNVNGGIVYTDASGNLNTSAVGTAGQVLQSNGAAAPTWVTPTMGTVSSVSGIAPINVANGTSTPVISLGTVPVANGGTGLTSVTTNGVLYGAGTGNLNVTASPSPAQVLLGNGAGIPTFTTVSGDATISSTGVITLNQNNNGYIKNQTTQQASSNFNISGSGVIGVGLTVGAGATIDNSDSNVGTIASNALAFGLSSGEGIASKRTAGGNRWGLDFYTNSANRMAITNTGNVGIGTTTPGATLNVIHQTANSTPTKPTGNWAAIIENNQDANDSRNGLAVAARWGGSETTIFEAASYWSGSAQAYTPILTVKGNRNVGIGNSAPAYKLDVSGDINFTSTVKFNGVNVLFNSATDVYGNIRVLQNNSTTLQDGMYLNYNSTGGTAAHLRFYANSTNERMRIDANTGYVGIGTTAPANKLHVGATEGQGIDIGNPNDAMGLDGGSNSIRFYGYRDVVSNAISAKISAERTNICCGWLSQGTDLAFYTNNGLVTANADNSLERMRIKDNGNVGIATTSPSEKLHVTGNTQIDGALKGTVRYYSSRTTSGSYTSSGAADYLSLDITTAGTYIVTFSLDGTDNNLSDYFDVYFCGDASTGNTMLTAYKTAVYTGNNGSTPSYTRIITTTGAYKCKIRIDGNYDCTIYSGSITAIKVN